MIYKLQRGGWKQPPLNFAVLDSNGRAVEYARVTYGNGAVYKSSATKDGSVITADNYRAEYNADGSISKEKDEVTGEEVTYTYDTLGRLKKAEIKKNGAVTQSTEYKYDGYGKLSGAERAGGECSFDGRSYYYTDDSRRRLNGESTQDKLNVAYKYDGLGRIVEKNIETLMDCNGVDTVKISYFGAVNATTDRPSRISYSGGEWISYNYSSNGNITRIDTNEEVYEYNYDSNGRLKEEYNSSFRFRKEYEYDNNGNIIKATEYEPAEDEEGNKVYVGDKLYVYENGRLVSYNGERCVYDSIGNPTTYRGKSAAWKGRQLTYFNGIAFTYDGRGRRISKGNITFTYDYAGNLIRQSNGLEFFYDSQGVAGFGYENDIYYYRKDAQGNIIAVLDSNGRAVVKYYYDAWGNHSISGNTTVGELNPYRYRGYYYDNETKLYFLQTRYYDPAVGRFLNMDSVDYADPSTIGGLNLYAYCNNDPINYVDPSGRFVLSSILLGCIIVGAAAGAVVGGYIAGDKASEAGATGWELFGWTLLGVVGGGVAGAAIGAVVGLAAPAIGGMLSGSLAVAGGGYTAAGVAGTAAVAGVGLLGVNVVFSRIGKSGGYIIDHHYPNDHDPLHVHISGDDGFTKVDLNGRPIQGNRPMSPGEKKAFRKLYHKILQALLPWI